MMGSHGGLLRLDKDRITPCWGMQVLMTYFPPVRLPDNSKYVESG